MKVLVLGHRSFAAAGLVDLLRAGGHEVTCFSRGRLARENGVVTGPMEELSDNPFLQRPFDTVLNYIILKDDDVAKNEAFAANLLKLTARCAARHLIHISSVSSCRAGARHIDESTPTESVPQKKGAYGSLKVAADLLLLKDAPASLKLTLVRPGFILGPGVVNPIIGNAARLPWNRILIIGNAKSHMPLITRDDVNKALVKIVTTPPEENREVLLLVAGNSPAKRTFVEVLCHRAGIGLGVTTLPAWIWLGIAVSAEVALRLLGQGKMNPYSKLASRLVSQTFDATATQKRLGMNFDFAWEPVLQDSLEGQSTNAPLPVGPAPLPRTKAADISFLGFGRIVKQKHLPGLRKLGFAGTIKAYDLNAGTDPAGQKIEAIQQATPGKADLFVVASPGPAHTAALDLLAKADGPILVEKPLCYTASDLDRWAQFAGTRHSPVYLCHNYRFKENVLRMAAHMRAYNPGLLKHVQIYFQSPPAMFDGALWLRAERKARTLLMDYSLHFLDLACMFANEPWSVQGVRHELDRHGNTALIEGRLVANYSVAFLLRQGFAPRRARLLLSFQNYTVSLGFFPDTFAVYMADDGAWLYKAEKKESWRATVAKVKDKLTSRDSDLSHARVLAGALGDLPEIAQNIQLQNVVPFYRMLFALADAVYG